MNLPRAILTCWDLRCRSALKSREMKNDAELLRMILTLADWMSPEAREIVFGELGTIVQEVQDAQRSDIS